VYFSAANHRTMPIESAESFLAKHEKAQTESKLDFEHRNPENKCGHPGIYLCVCIYACMYVCIYMYMCIYVYTCMYIYICIYV
jgi:hypothetical protein